MEPNSTCTWARSRPEAGNSSCRRSPHLPLHAQSAPASTRAGYLLFTRKHGLVAQPFDASRRVLTGDPIPLPDIVDAVGDQWMAGRAVSTSDDGTFVYVANRTPESTLVWVDRSGKSTPAVTIPAGRYINVGLTRDARRASLLRWVSPTQNDLWSVDLERGGASRLTDAVGQMNVAVWSPDGERIVYATNHGEGMRNLFVKPMSGEKEESLYSSPALVKDPSSWSDDGRFLVYRELSSATLWDLWVLPLAGDRKPFPFARSKGTDDLGIISPDGRWLAYVSDESGRNEIYVQSFPSPARKYRVTADGGSRVWWRRDSRQLLIGSLDFTEL